MTKRGMGEQEGRQAGNQTARHPGPFLPFLPPAEGDIVAVKQKPDHCQPTENRRFREELFERIREQ